MTDNEIKKALECCANLFDCPGCPYRGDCGNVQALTKDALDLINRQKAEIERLKEDFDFNIKLNGLLQEQRDGRDEQIIELDEKIDKLNRALQTAKSEAIKEFTKKFEKKIKDVKFTLGQTWEIQNALKDTLKEMVGDDNA